MSNPSFPITAPPPEAIPHRRLIRAWLAPLAGASTPLALALVALDLALLAASLAAVILLRHPALKLLASVGCGLAIGRLFILGHDACHQSLTRHRTLNRWIGRLVFLPSLTPYSLWEVGHNVVHHGYTNLRGFDFVWQPRTLEEFRALPRGRRVAAACWSESIAAAGRRGSTTLSRSGGPGCCFRTATTCRRAGPPSSATVCW